MVITKARQFFNYLIFILIGFGISSLIFSFIINPEIIEVGKEQPMLLLLHDSWGENIDDSEELIFRHYIYNFGDIEAKNIIITCQLSLGLGEGDIVFRGPRIIHGGMFAKDSIVIDIAEDNYFSGEFNDVPREETR